MFADPLSSSARNILSAMNIIGDQIGETQKHIQTGQKVNSPSDNAVNYSIAATLKTNADDYTKLQDSMRQGVKALETTIGSLNSINEVLNQMQAQINTANATQDTTARTNASTQFNTLLAQLTNLANDSNYNGLNLIGQTSTGGTYDMHIVFGITTTNPSSLTITSIGSTAASLGVITAGNNWADSTDIAASQSVITAAITSVRSSLNTFGSQMTMIKIRDTFTTNMINTLKDGAGQLTEANMTEEAAKLNSLQMQSYMGNSMLSFEKQTQQSLLRLFG